jgi:NifU-like domain
LTCRGRTVHVSEGVRYLAEPQGLRLTVRCVIGSVLDDLQVRPYLMSDGGNVEFVEIDGPVVYLRLQVSVMIQIKSHTVLLCRTGWRDAMGLCQMVL